MFERECVLFLIVSSVAGVIALQTQCNERNCFQVIMGVALDLTLALKARGND